MSDPQHTVPAAIPNTALRIAADVLRPLFRHGGSAGTGISYGFNPAANGYGIWDHERDDWFPGQEFVGEVRDIDGAAYFAAQVLRAIDAN